jgi:4-hydroxy-2-oxoheptanedioate aldolase
VRRNILREKLTAGQPTFGTKVHSTWPSIVEVIGHTRVFDYVQFEAEYAPFDLFALENFCRAAELFNMSTMIKIDQEPRRFLAQRAIGAGFQGVLFADCRTPADARESVLSVRPDTPEDGGFHGVGFRRFAYMYDGGSAEYVSFLRGVVVALMIEKQSAVEQLEAILSGGGVDLVQWGRTDYSMSIGRPGAWDAPDVKAVERRVIDICQKKGIPTRAAINSLDQVEYYLDLGVRHFDLSTDIVILHNWLKANGEKLKDTVLKAYS